MTMHVKSSLTHDLLSPTPTTPITTVRDKQTSALKQLADIFNMSVPPKATPPTPPMLQQKNSPMPPLRVYNPETTPEAAPMTSTRVEPQGNIPFRPGQAPRCPTQCATHNIPYDTESFPLAAHQNTTGIQILNRYTDTTNVNVRQENKTS